MSDGITTNLTLKKSNVFCQKLEFQHQMIFKQYDLAITRIIVMTKANQYNSYLINDSNEAFSIKQPPPPPLKIGAKGFPALTLMVTVETVESVAPSLAL